MAEVFRDASVWQRRDERRVGRKKGQVSWGGRSVEVANRDGGRNGLAEIGTGQLGRVIGIRFVASWLIPTLKNR